MRPEKPHRLLSFLAVGTGLATACILAVTVSVTTPIRAAEDEGLRGVFPKEVPDALTYDAFENLPPTWETWNEETVAALDALYSGKLGAAEQREKLADLQGRLATIREALGSSEYAPIHDDLRTLAGRMQRRLELAALVLDLLESDGSLRGPLSKMVSALEAYEDENAQDSAANVRKLLRELDEKSPEAAEKLWSYVLLHYLNYNVRASVGEGLFKEVVQECRIEGRPVRDCFMGTRLVGDSTTTSQIGFNLVPNSRQAEFEIEVDGEVRSRTTGYNAKATLFSTGRHYFKARKRVRFDGYRFNSQPASISVNANNNTYAARTKYSKIPILGKIANKIAVKEAAKRRPKSEAFARRRVGENVLPEFNAEVDDQLAEQNVELANEVRPRFEEVGLQPETLALSSTSSMLLASARMMNGDELAGTAPLDLAAPLNGAILQLHESALNNGIDRIGLAGQSLTETELRQKIADFASSVAGKTVEIDPPAEEDGNKFVFAKKDPIRVQFENGSLVVTLKTGLKRPGEEDLPEQEVTIVLNYSVEGDVLKVTRDTVKVSAKQGIATAAVLRSRIQKSIPEERDREAVLELEQEDSSETTKLSIDSIDMLDGWLVLVLSKG